MFVSTKLIEDNIRQIKQIFRSSEDQSLRESIGGFYKIHFSRKYYVIRNDNDAKFRNLLLHNDFANPKFLDITVIFKVFRL